MAQQKPKTTSRTRANPEKTFTDNKFQPIHAKTDKQKKLFSAASNFQIVAATGVAGTGKTHVLVSYAAQELHKGNIEKIVITRPYQSAVDEEYGFLPGSIEEKFSWVITPVRTILEKCLGKSMVEYMLKTGAIEGVPLGFLRGRTFESDTIVIADEMQNASPQAAETLLTRLGGSCKCFITGDSEQSDIKGINGLDVMLKYSMWMPYAKHIEFGLDDIVRSSITSDIIKSFRQYRQDLLNDQV